jgi:hypothetical protein
LESLIFFSAIWSSLWPLAASWLVYKLTVLWTSGKNTTDDLNRFAPVENYENFRARLLWLQQRAVTHIAGTGANILAAFAGTAIGRWLGENRFFVSELGFLGENHAKWTVGIVLSVVVGGFVTSFFLALLRWSVAAKKPEGTKGVPAWLTGAIERAFFTVVIGLGYSEVLAAMIAWLGVKLAANWKARLREPDGRVFAISAVLAGLVSMLFAYMGGLVVSGVLTWR